MKPQSLRVQGPRAELPIIVEVLPVSAFVENVYIVGDEESKEAMVIDPGAEAEQVLELVEQLGLRVKYIVDTHGHLDHVGAVKPVKEHTGALFGIHQRDIPIMRSISRTLVESLLPDFQPPPDPDLDLKGGDVLEVGKLRFTVMETPGHTPGGLCFYGHGVIFTGDTLFNRSVGRTDLPGGNWQHLLTSIHGRLMTLPGETLVFPGHGPHTTIEREKRHNPFLKMGSLSG